MKRISKNTLTISVANPGRDQKNLRSLDWLKHNSLHITFLVSATFNRFTVTTMEG